MNRLRNGSAPLDGNTASATAARSATHTPFGVSVDRRRGQPQSEAGLAAAPRSGELKHAGAVKHAGQLVEFSLATDEARQLHRQIVRDGI